MGTAGAYNSSLEQSSNTLNCMYLQGYGALFQIKVNFPLSAPPETQQQEEEQTNEEDVDTVWEQTRQQIYEPQATSSRSSRDSDVKYDSQKVENLKNRLIQALKQASNIRILNTNESVIIKITGTGQIPEVSWYE